jgi:hypothetical protein
MDTPNPFYSLIQLLLNILEAHTAAFFLFEPGKRSLKLAAVASMSRQVAPDLALPLEGSGILSQVLKQSQDVHLKRISQEDIASRLPFYRDAESDIKGLFATPVGEGVGVLYVDTKRSWGFNRNQIEWTREFARLLLEQYTNLQSIRSCDRYARILQLWYHLDELSFSDCSSDQYFRGVLNLCTDFLKVSHGLLAVREPEDGHYRLLAATSEIPTGYMGKDFAVDQGLVGRVLESEKALLIKRLKPEAAEHFLLFPGESLPHAGTFWGLPIEAGTGEVYALVFLSRQPLTWDSDHQYAISRVLQFVRILLERAWYLKQCERLHYEDPTTGLWNARAFEAHFEEALAECMRDSASLTLALVQFEPWQQLYRKAPPRELRYWQEVLAYNLGRAGAARGVRIGQLAENRFALLFPDSASREVRVLLQTLSSLEWQVVLKRSRKIKLRPFSSYVRYPNDATTTDELWPLAYRRLYSEFPGDEKAPRDPAK